MVIISLELCTSMHSVSEHCVGDLHQHSKTVHTVTHVLLCRMVSSLTTIWSSVVPAKGQALPVCVAGIDCRRRWSSASETKTGAQTLTDILPQTMIRAFGPGGERHQRAAHQRC